MKRLLFVLATILVSACSRRSPDPPATLPEVRVWGALRAIMHEGKTGPQIAIAEATTERHTYGVGALSGLRGEVTIVDGIAWTSYPNDDGSIRVLRGAPAGESATLLAAARVSAWRSVIVSSDIGPDELDERLEALARANGIDTDKAFPLVLEGGLADVRWHVLDGRKLVAGGGHEDHLRGSATGGIGRGQGMLVGFFSKHHQGVFTHLGQRTHFHVLTSDHAIMGHADRAGVRARSVLKLPVTGS